MSNPKPYPVMGPLRIAGITDDISQDPQASPESIMTLSKKNPLLALAHPNCPVDLWFLLAETYPVEALRSAAAPLLLLESPERWHKLEAKYAAMPWVSGYSDWLTPEQQQAFSADCLEHVLPLYDLIRVSDPDVPAMIAVRRQMGRAEISIQEGLAQVERIYRRKPAGMFPHWSANTLRTTASSSGEKPVRSIAWGTRSALGFSTGQQDPKAEIDEAIWQWHRLLEYLGVTSPLASGDAVGAFFTTELDWSGWPYDIMVNPIVVELDKLGLAKGQELRTLIVGDKLYAWNALHATHADIAKLLGVNEEYDCYRQFMYRQGIDQDDDSKQLVIKTWSPIGRPLIDWTTHPYFQQTPRLFKKYQVSFVPSRGSMQYIQREGGEASWVSFPTLSWEAAKSYPMKEQ